MVLTESFPFAGRSRQISNVRLYDFANATSVESSDGSAVLTPTILRPFGPYSLYRASRLGISARQGAHQVAQRFTITTCPLYSLRRWTACEYRSVAWNSGARDPTSTGNASSRTP